MYKQRTIALSFASFFILFISYFSIESFIFINLDLSSVFLTISTFLFAIFTGFFIARQGTRYSSIRSEITAFDGSMSAMYRLFGHLGVEAQKQAERVIKNHYETILQNHSWDWHFTHKSQTISSLHRILEDSVGDANIPTLRSHAVHRILFNLRVLQQARKSMIALHTERIPRSQWVLIIFLGIILLVAISTIPSASSLLGILLKSALGTTVILVLILLHEFDTLQFFEGTIGERSAHDILDIFTGAK